MEQQLTSLPSAFRFPAQTVPKPPLPMTFSTTQRFSNGSFVVFSNHTTANLCSNKQFSNKSAIKHKFNQKRRQHSFKGTTKQWLSASQSPQLVNSVSQFSQPDSQAHALIKHMETQIKVNTIWQLFNVHIHQIPTPLSSPSSTAYHYHNHEDNDC